MRSVAYVFVALILLGGFVAIGYGIATREQIVVQPIAFNHAVHIEDAGMQCIECHTDAETDVSAGLPGKEMCMDCHDIDEEEGTHTEKARLFSYAESDRDIPWVRVAVTAPDVFFSHRRHVTAGRMDCLECHPQQPGLTAPPSTARMVLTMDACIDCHENTGASDDCLACHR